MRLTIFSAMLAAALPGSGMAQGWELRAGLDMAMAQVCAEDGTCFGVQCSASGDWAPGWMAQLLPLGDGAATDPILAIRMNGLRFALTSLIADGPQGSYTAPVAEQDAALLEALQRGSVVSVDPGRDFAMAELSLRGSRWAIGEALALCASEGPNLFGAAEETPPE